MHQFLIRNVRKKEEQNKMKESIMLISILKLIKAIQWSNIKTLKHFKET